ncbi:MAG: hypothetical protein ACE5E8_05860 [Acidimicrobiia bacterium]
MNKASTRFSLLVAGVITVVATIDAARETDWDILVMLVVVDLLLIGLALRLGSGRVPVRVRRDLYVWAQRRATATGQTVERTVDRAVTSYRERLEPSPYRPSLPEEVHSP